MRDEGFTIIELTVILLVSFILITIAIPNYITAQTRSAQASVKNNMHATQLCVEAYAADENGSYPTDATVMGFGSYFPYGDENKHTLLGMLPNNPYSGLQMVPGDFNPFVYAASGDNADQTIGGPNDIKLGGAGLIRYGVWADYPYLCTEYGIIGARGDSLTIRSRGAVLVLFNRSGVKNKERGD